MIDDLGDYGVYADAVDVDFDVQELLESDDSVHEHENTNEANRAKDITARQRQHIYEALLQRRKIKKEEHNCSSRTLLSQPTIGAPSME
jgi:bacterioferritin (cytochrome b1)